MWEDISGMVLVAIIVFLVCCLTIIPWALGIAQMWGSIFGA